MGRGAGSPGGHDAEGHDAEGHDAEAQPTPEAQPAADDAERQAGPRRSLPFAARGLRGRAVLEHSSPATHDLRYRMIVEHVASGRRAEAVTYIDTALTDDERRLRLVRSLVILAGQLDPDGPWSSLSL